jgi:hypothetical protein
MKVPVTGQLKANERSVYDSTMTHSGMRVKLYSASIKVRQQPRHDKNNRAAVEPGYMMDYLGKLAEAEREAVRSVVRSAAA